MENQNTSPECLASVETLMNDAGALCLHQPQNIMLTQVAYLLYYQAFPPRKAAHYHSISYLNPCI